MKILVVEDDEIITESLIKYLTDQYYSVDVATDGKGGWELVEAFTYDLIVLDVMLPKLDGISFCRQMRSHNIKTLVLLLTAADSSTHKIMGLDAGADDYMTKPFDLEEFSARIRALLRRGNSTLLPELKWGNLRLDPSICQVTYNNQPLHLTPKEYGLLELFLRNTHRVFSRSAIIDHLWSFEEPPGDDTVRAHIKGLRMKLKAGGVTSDPIETVYGIGYRLKAIPEDQIDKLDVEDHRGTRSELEEKTHKITASVWERAKERLSHRIGVIEEATAALYRDALDEELLTKAYEDAHKLAGSLGMFGFESGSNLAFEIEHLFQPGLSLIQQQKQRLSELVTALRRELQLSTINLTSKLPLDDQRQTLLIVADDQLLTDSLVKSAADKGIECQIVTDAVQAQKQIDELPPNAVVLDYSLEGNEDSLRLLTNTPVPVLVLANQHSLIDRVKVARLGGRGFLPKPVAATKVIEVVANMIERKRDLKAKVLLVDDDPEVLTAASHLLQAWGLKVFLLENPLLFWDTLETTAPDLLVLDVEMSQINGIDLCQVVRNDPRYQKMPVIFLTSHTDGETKRQVFAAGADDYISKPNLGTELVTRILNRLERSRIGAFGINHKTLASKLTK